MDNIIKSRENGKIKLIVKLINSAKERQKTGLFVIEGLRLCTDAVMSGARIQAVFFSQSFAPDFCGDFRHAASESFVLSDDIFKKISDTVSPQGILCICKQEKSEISIKKGGHYLLLENINNPQNLGTIARTAEAFSLDGLFLSENCCDIYNPKAQRASMGSFFRISATVCNLCETIEALSENGIDSFAAVPDRNAAGIHKINFKPGGAVAIGNEANGLSETVKSCCKTQITIPVSGRAESLNAAAAASILIWEMSK